MSDVHELELPARRPSARRVELTEPILKKIKPGEKVIDAKCPGLFALGLMGGKVSLRVKADVPQRLRRFELSNGGRTIERVVGTWPGISAKAARPIARVFLSQIQRGVDPSPKATVTAAASWTVQETFDRYIGSYLTREAAADSTKRTYRYSFDRLPPKWRTRPMREVIADTDGLKSLHEQIRRKIVAKTPRKSLKPSTGENSANATINLLSILAGYARGSDVTLPVWAARAVDKFPERSRSKQGMALSDVAAWWHDVQSVENETKRWLSLFMMVTGLRPGNAVSAAKQNLKEGKHPTLHIPLAKGHRPDREEYDRAFTIPLCELAMECIRRAQALQRRPSDLLFAGPGGAKLSAHTLTSNGRRFKDGQLMRHTFETIAEMDLGIELWKRQRLMNHKPETQTEQYAHPLKVGPPLIEAAAKIGAAIAKEIGL